MTDTGASIQINVMSLPFFKTYDESNIGAANDEPFGRCELAYFNPSLGAQESWG